MVKIGEKSAAEIPKATLHHSGARQLGGGWNAAHSTVIEKAGDFKSIKTQFAVSFTHKAKTRLVLKVKISTIYECSLERAFKTPMLCDVSKVHTGFGIMPKVTHTTEDENWGKPGFSKKVHVAPSLTQKGGFASVDTVLERVENQYWKIQVDQFQAWMLGFYKFVGTWKTTQLEPNKVLIEYSYDLHSNVLLLCPLNWIFAKTFWKTYMKRVLENIRTLAYENEPYLYD